jgi:hypothetical protein
MPFKKNNLPKKKKKLPTRDGCQNIIAKLLLRDLIDAGEIDQDLDPEDANFLYLMRYPEEFEYYDYHDNNFSDKLKSLFNTWTENTKKAVFDKKAFAHDMKLLLSKETNSRGEPRWEGSEAETCLREDFAARKHKKTISSPKTSTRQDQSTRKLTKIPSGTTSTRKTEESDTTINAMTREKKNSSIQGSS